LEAAGRPDLGEHTYSHGFGKIVEGFWGGIKIEKQKGGRLTASRGEQICGCAA